MSRYVLDTHALLYHLEAPKKLGRKARAAFKRVDEGTSRALVPAATVAEVIILRELGRVGIGLPELKVVFEETPAFEFLPLDLSQLDLFATLAAIRDPFERLIISAAKASEARLITRDQTIGESGLVETLW